MHIVSRGEKGSCGKRQAEGLLEALAFIFPGAVLSFEARLHKGIRCFEKLRRSEQIAAAKIFGILPRRILLSTKRPREFHAEVGRSVLHRELKHGDRQRKAFLRPYGTLLSAAVACLLSLNSTLRLGSQGWLLSRYKPHAKPFGKPSCRVHRIGLATALPEDSRKPPPSHPR